MWRALLCALIVLPLPAAAKNAGTTGTWLGSGAVFSPEGKKLVSYGVKVSKTMRATGELETRIEQTQADGSVIQSCQVQVTGPDGATHVRGDDLEFDVWTLNDRTAHTVIGTAEGEKVIVTIVGEGDWITVVKTVLNDMKVLAFVTETLIHADAEASE